MKNYLIANWKQNKNLSEVKSFFGGAKVVEAKFLVTHLQEVAFLYLRQHSIP
jgi:hypothetical protein